MCANDVLVPAAPLRHSPAELAARLAAIAERDGYTMPVQALYLGVVGWTRLHGIVMLELFNNCKLTQKMSHR